MIKKKFILSGLDCANCAAKIEKAVSELDGVKEASVNFIMQKMTIEGEDDKMSQIIEQAEMIVKKTEPGTVMRKA